MKRERLEQNLAVDLLSRNISKKEKVVLDSTRGEGRKFEVSEETVV